MVFVPVDPAALARLPTEPATGLGGFAATAALCRAHGYDLAATGEAVEDADYEAFGYAALDALRTGVPGGGPRTIVAAEVADGAWAAAADEADLGRVRVHRLGWDAVRAVFLDEDAAADAVDRARSEAAGLDLADLVELPVASRLLAEHPLLWHAPDEVTGL